MENSSGLIQLAEKDNVLVVCSRLEAGETLNFGKVEYVIKQAVALGHKIALKDIEKGEKVIKFNMVIGSATEKISKGAHVHIHNLKSDFIPTYTIDKQNKLFG